MEGLGWECVEKFLDEQRYPRSRFVLGSYDDFLQVGLRKIIAAANPMEFKMGSDTLNVLVGGDDADYKFVPAAQNGTVVTPAYCRENDETYSCDVVADVVCRWQSGQRSGETIVPDVRLFSMPTMLHSSACVLRGETPAGLHAKGECMFDEGGYFVVDGHEKVVRATEVTAYERPVLVKIADSDARAIHVAWEATVRHPGMRRTILSISPKSAVKLTFDVQNRRNVKRSVELPLATAFRALGVDTDEAIASMIVPHCTAKDVAAFLYPSFEEAGRVAGWTGPAAVQYIRSVAGRSSATVSVPDAHAVIDDLMSGARPDLRARQLGMIVGQVLSDVSAESPTDRDRCVLRRIEDVGAQMRDLVESVYSEFVRYAKDAIAREPGSEKHVSKIVDETNVSRFFQPAIVTDVLRSALKGRWPTMSGTADGLVHELPRATIQSAAAYTNMVVNPLKKGLMSRKPRQLHSDTFGFKCPNHTPEGLEAGLVQHMALTSKISGRNVDAELVRKTILDSGAEASSVAGTAVVVDGILFAMTSDPSALREKLVEARRAGELDPEVSVAWIPGSTVQVNTDAGRWMRPLLIVRDGKLVVQTPGFSEHLPPAKTPEKSSSKRSSKQSSKRSKTPDLEVRSEEDAQSGGSGPVGIEYLDAYEIDCCLIAMHPDDIGPLTTHMEFHGTAMLSTVSLMTPYANHNQAPRNVFSCKQTTACASLYSSVFSDRWDVSVDLLHHAQRPLVTTRFATRFHANEMPYGENAIVAIMSASGYNMEDSVMMNAHAVQRGLFQTTHMTTVSCEEEGRERFCNPMASGCTNIKEAAFNKIDGMGLPVPGAYIETGDVLVGKASPGPDGLEDRSLVADITIHGTVLKSTVVPIAKGARKCKVRLGDMRYPTVGDKFASRHGQKGIIGRLVQPEDMPWTEDGIVPDVVINPHCLPSRMTVGHVLEALFAKASVLDGQASDATAFMKHDLAAAGDRVAAAGKEANGDELMASGPCGLQLAVPTFLCPTYYMRLKQQVADKVAAANGGRKMAVTGQPARGRANGGGIRMGEMEHDSLVAHGVSAFMKETYLDRSDKPARPYTVVDGRFSSEHSETRTHDRMDESAARTETFGANVPVAFKTLVAELAAIGIGTKLGGRRAPHTPLHGADD
jgi:DNA-directed RNA polymerase beta subunit